MTFACAGTVSGLQGSLASFFQSLSYLVGIILPDPRHYQWLMTGSYNVVVAAAVIFSIWALMVKKPSKDSLRVAGDAGIELGTPDALEFEAEKVRLVPNCKS